MIDGVFFSTDRHFPRIAGWVILLSMLLAAPLRPLASSETDTFYRGLNLNGPALMIQGRSWQGAESKQYVAEAKAFENQQVTLDPVAEGEMGRMIRSSRWGDVRIRLQEIPPGPYEVYVYVWEDNNPETFQIRLDGRPVAEYRSGPAGRWDRLGPWRVEVRSGSLLLETVGGAANISGIEIHHVTDAVPPTADQIAFFERRIRPLLADRCYACHSGDADPVEGELWLDTRHGIRRGGVSGPAIVPGDPQASLLMKAVRRDGKLQMPPDEQLADDEVADLETWIRMGAPDPRDGDGAAQRQRLALEEARKFWSLRPLVQPELPTVGDPAWPQNEIDLFILARLEDEGLRPVGTADRATLLRRATFDLTGLPPTPHDIQAFLEDPDPLQKALAKVIERLLESQQYGERWGRHWMDLVRYADTAGDNSDYPVPQAYLYRNYVIQAFNHDKPYDQFVREQIAGDLLKADTPQQRNEQTIATGYIAISRRFGSIVDGYPQHLTIEDTLDNLGRTFLGLTISCARCHDHKFDPISQEDYYGLYGIFDSTRYPFPGIELDKKPRDLVQLEPQDGMAEKLAYAVSEGAPHDAAMHLRGEPKQPGEMVPRKFLDVLGGQRLEAADQSGRLQLAQWLTSPDNPLLARVMVNRIWQQHFGEGLVQTPSDFGSRGAPPTHPELLDWLAIRFQQEGYSIKHMHRLMMLSRTYQLASHDDEGNLAVDPDSHLRWRFSRRRLDAESLRDTLLAISGGLDPSMMNQPHPFPPAAQWEFTQHHPFKDEYPSQRRSVYLMTRRLTAKPFFTTFDGADRNATTPRREASVTSTQALYLMNDQFVHERAAAFAERLLAEAANDDERLELACLLALGRLPNTEERESVAVFRDACRQMWADQPAEQQARLAWQSFARALFCTNEFLYVD